MWFIAIMSGYNSSEKESYCYKRDAIEVVNHFLFGDWIQRGKDIGLHN